MERTYCVFGDSISQAAYITNNWIERLRKYLENKYPDSFISVFNLGINGQTTSDILQRFDNEAMVRKPTSLIFQIGTNDSGYFRIVSKPITPPEFFRDNLKELISRAKKITRDISFLGLTIGDDSLTQPLAQSSRGKTYTKKRIEDYDLILKQTVEKNGCRHIELSGILEPEDFSDGLHPNDHGHELIFNQVKRYF